MSEVIGNQTNVRIARMLGVLRVTHADDGGTYYDGEDYENDLNAMHEVEKTLDGNERMVDGRLYCSKSQLYRANLGEICFDHSPIHASSAQRAEAFLKTMEGE